ncbi:membrane hypothetical protein [Mesorhizobium plurifarium]|uniref:Transmembrane protein n=1 Tax=Mesorhizobium plurifarium TaxID=69974 RepID=A0A0K2W5W5_MESPL|nr:membrane hypothetical protein [Mesorhizobium plurifarium]
MKLGSLEGTPEEIKNFFEINNSNLDHILTPPRARRTKTWTFPPCIIFAIFAISTQFAFFTRFVPTMVSFIVLLLLAIWIAAVIHIFFDKPWASYLVFFGLLLVALVTCGFVNPADLPTLVEKVK